MGSAVNFFTVSLPRCGTAWLSNFLTFGPLKCTHDLLLDCGSWDEVRARLGNGGMADTASPLFLDRIRYEFPDSRYIVIHRPEAEVLASLERVGLPTEGMETMAAAFHSANVDGLHVEFASLFTLPTMRRIWNYLADEPMDEARALMLADMKVEANIERYWTRFDPERTKGLL